MTPPTTTAALIKLMTADEYWEYCQRPENADRRTELIRGEVVEMSRPTKPHGVVINQIAYYLTLWIESSGAPGYVAIDAGLVLEDSPGTVVGPDVAYYTDANTFEEVPPKWGDVPPVLAVEVLSPNDKRRKVDRKVADYLDGEVPVVWLVNYEEEYVTVHRPNQTPLVLEGGELSGGPELPGFTVPLERLFRIPGLRPAPPPPPSA